VHQHANSRFSLDSPNRLNTSILAEVISTVLYQNITLFANCQEKFLCNLSHHLKGGRILALFPLILVFNFCTVYHILYTLLNFHCIFNIFFFFITESTKKVLFFHIVHFSKIFNFFFYFFITNFNSFL